VNGDWLTLGAVGALALAGALRRRRGSTNDEEEELPFLLEVSHDGWCHSEEGFEYPWEDGDPPPTGADLRSWATERIEDLDISCDWEFDGNWNTKEGAITRQFEFGRTLDGRFKLKKKT
jgi:hypothetical protein